MGACKKVFLEKVQETKTWIDLLEIIEEERFFLHRNAKIEEGTSCEKKLPDALTVDLRKI